MIDPEAMKKWYELNKIETVEEAIEYIEANAPQIKRYQRVYLNATLHSMRLSKREKSEVRFYFKL